MCQYTLRFVEYLPRIALRRKQPQVKATKEIWVAMQLGFLTEYMLLTQPLTQACPKGYTSAQDGKAANMVQIWTSIHTFRHLQPVGHDV